MFLLLVGELRTGPDRRGDYGRQLLAACEALGADCYHAGTVDPARMHEYYQVADLAVVPSEFEEPFGMVAIEAMAAGIPCSPPTRAGCASSSFRMKPVSSSRTPSDYAASPGKCNRVAPIARPSSSGCSAMHAPMSSDITGGKP